jgi:hypothetical protein
MAKTDIEFAGDFDLPSIVLHNHKNKGRPVDGNKTGVDIKQMVQEFNIYENMYKGAMTGSLVISDAVNLIGNLPIQGTERLTFKLATPGQDPIDCSDETGNPMYIYKLTDKQQHNDGMQIYVLHFCSREFLRNLRTKVSKAYSGTFDQMVNAIMYDKELLDTRKKVFFQKTRNQDKIVVPNRRPFSAISMMCKRALAENSKSAGYYFWETSKGFHFRSWESLCVEATGRKRKSKQTFRYMPMNITDDNVDEKILHDFTSVEEYKFVNNFHDVAANTALGTYAHRVITHNLYDKSYRHDDYHYHDSYRLTKHTEPNVPIVDSAVDYDDNGISDYPESRVTVMPTTQFAHGEDTGAYGIEVEQDGKTEGLRESLVNQTIAGTKLVMTVKGQSILEVGDVIRFDLISVENRVNSAGRLDPQYSGRYIITKIRHRVTKDDYKMVLECSKDSVAQPYSDANTDRFPGKEPQTYSDTIDITEKETVQNTRANAYLENDPSIGAYSDIGPLT